jgi:SPP1 gp7 family putative phage head morphogenesis protein
MGWAVTADPARFDEACDWFLKRVVLTEAQALELGTDAGRRAFWIGNGLQLSQVQRVFDELAKANESGEPFEEWRKRVRKELRNDAHAETVFRNATQRSLNAGRYQQMRDAQKWRPYWMHDSVLDSRTTETCKRLDGVTLPADHEHWKTHWPPGHHRCRRSVRSLRKSEGEKRVTNVPPIAPSDPGFGAAPDADPEWKPDPSKFDPELYRELQKKADKPRKAKPKPGAPPKEHDPKHWAKRYEKQYGEAAECIGWGRAMYERGLDRSAADVVAELRRLKDAGYPGVSDVAIRSLGALEANRPLRAQLVAAEKWRGLIAVQEHTRTIQVGEFKIASNLPATREAERFYELTLDKSVRRPTDWRVQHEPGIRSFATDHDYRDAQGRFYPKNTVALGRANDGPTAIHEFAHAIEFSDAKTLARSRRLLRARAKGGLRRLSDDLPDRGFKPHEFYFPDDFPELYWGKEYGESATEITSMGFQAMARDLDLEILVEKHPELLHFLLGQLAGR